MTNNPNTPERDIKESDDQSTLLDCLACETLVTDVLDEQLSPAEQASFDRHLQSCAFCTEAFAQAQQGAALLALLKNPRPQPRPELLEAILAQTSGSELPVLQTTVSPLAATVPGIAAADGPIDRLVSDAGRLLPFRPRAFAPRFGQILLEPRLAMTAAMAFFSITLTMSLTGVHLNDVRLSSLSPSGARRLLHTTEAGVIRYYDNLRVVHVLESRVENLRETLQGSRDSEVPAQPEPGRHRPETHGRRRPAAPDAGTSRLTPQRLAPHPPAPAADAAVAVSLNPPSPNGDRS